MNETSKNILQPEVFLPLLSACEPSLRAYVRSQVPTRDDMQEIMQDVSLALWRKLDRIMTVDEFRRWAFGVARYEVLAFYRDRARERVVFDEETVAMLAIEHESIAERIDLQRDALESCLQRLSNENRELVCSAYQSDAKIDIIAAQRGRTTAAVYKALHRIRLALVECTRNALAGGVSA